MLPAFSLQHITALIATPSVPASREDALLPEGLPFSIMP
jgi:hypothetical protein